MELGAVIKHNIKNSPKTGDWRYMKPEVDASKCIGCGTCVLPCPEGVMEVKSQKSKVKSPNEENLSEKKIVEIDYEYCKGCGVCAQICPLRAITMKK